MTTEPVGLADAIAELSDAIDARLDAFQALAARVRELEALVARDQHEREIARQARETETSIEPPTIVPCRRARRVRVGDDGPDDHVMALAEAVAAAEDIPLDLAIRVAWCAVASLPSIKP